MISLINEAEVLGEAAASLRAHRQALGWRQADLASRSGVAIATLRRFERTGQIGLSGFAKLLVTLGLADGLLEALKPSSAAPQSIEAFLAAGQPMKTRTRVRLARTKA